MKRPRNTAMLLLFCILTVWLSGCGVRSTETGAGYPIVAAMENTPIVDYVVPKSLPNVLVNCLGYQSDSEKEAAVKGENLPDEFRLVDAVTKEVVYTGTLRKVTYNAELDSYTGAAVFDKFQMPGEYYVECDVIGRSYTFSIKDDFYAELFYDVYEEMIQECYQGTLPLLDGVALLTAYEWYPGIFPDEDEDGIPDVLMAMAEWMEQYEESPDVSQQALHAAFLAKYSYLYQNYDIQYATACLQMASSLFNQAQNTISKDAECFLALTELYRATGLYTYRNQIQDYKSYFENNSSYLEEKGYLYGSMTYLVTRQKVDVALCDTFMKNLMERGEENAGRYTEIIHPVAARNNGTEDVLQRAEELVFANYVLNSFQYHNMLREFWDYLCGKNLESVCFYEEDEAHGGYILLLAQLSAQVVENSKQNRG